MWRACALKLSCVRLFVTPWTVAHQAPLSMELPRQEYWSGLPFLTPLYVISKVFSCVLQENQGELCILHLVWNWNADGFWNHHMRELPCCFQFSVGIVRLIRRLQCWIKSVGTPPTLSHYQTQGILEASMAHILPRRLRMSSSTPGVRASLLWTCLSYLAHHPWLPPSFSFWKPEADLSPCMSCPWACAMHLPHCLLICVPVIWGEVPKSLSQRPLYIFLRLQAQPRFIICLEDALGSEWVWRGQCCWKLGFGGLWLEKMCVKSFGFLNITCGISQSPQIVKICEKSLTWSRQLKLLFFTQVSNPRDSKWKRAEFRIKVS